MRTQRLNLQGRSPLQSGEFPGESRTIDPVRSPLTRWVDSARSRVTSQTEFVTPGILLAAGLSYARAWREESSPHLKPINKMLSLIRIATAVLMAGGLAIMVLSAQDDLDTVRQAADQGDATAQFELGYKYRLGQGVPWDDAEAVRWFRLAAEQGHARAQVNLGDMYSNGRGVLKDDAEAVRWYRMVAEQGEVTAQFNLGLTYASGRGVIEDEAEAVKWYRLAAEQGYANAQHNLGAMYALGRGVLKDSVRAHMWFNIAGANGDEAARELRDNLEDDMTRAEISRATELARTCMTSDYKDCEP